MSEALSGEGGAVFAACLQAQYQVALVDEFQDSDPRQWAIFHRLFVEPVNVYRGAKVKIEAVLANEDMLRPGSYPVRFEIFEP